MCLFRIFKRNPKVIPESHIASIKDDYIKFVQELREYKEFMERTLPTNIDYSTINIFDTELMDGKFYKRKKRILIGQCI